MLKGYKKALCTGCKMAVRVAWLGVLRNLEDYSVTLKRMAMAWKWK